MNLIYRKSVITICGVLTPASRSQEELNTLTPSRPETDYKTKKVNNKDISLTYTKSKSYDHESNSRDSKKDTNLFYHFHKYLQQEFYLHFNYFSI